MKFHTVLLTAALLGTCAAQGPPSIVWSPTTTRPEVVDTKANITINPDASGDHFGDLAEDTMASQIADRGHILNWAPLWLPHGAGRPNLPAATLSVDGSVLAVIETVGAAAGPRQSRIVCIHPGTGKVLRIIELKERSIERIHILNGRNEALLYQAGQKVFEQPNRLIKVSLETGSVTGEFPPFKGELRDLSLSHDGRQAAAIEKGSPNIQIYDLTSPGQPPVTFDSETQEGLTAFSPDGKLLLLATAKQLQFFDLANPGTRKRNPLNLPAGPKPDLFTAAPDQANEMLLGTLGGPLYLIRGERSFPLDDNFEGFASFADDMIMLVTMAKSTVRLLDRNTLREVARFQAKADRPITRGNLEQVFYQNGFLLVIDSQGNIYTRKPIKQRWGKNLLIEAYK